MKNLIRLFAVSLAVSLVIAVLLSIPLIKQKKEIIANEINEVLV